MNDKTGQVYRGDAEIEAAQARGEELRMMERDEIAEYCRDQNALAAVRKSLAVGKRRSFRTKRAAAAAR